VVTKSNGPLLLAGTRVTGTQPHLGTFYGWLRPVAAAEGYDPSLWFNNVEFIAARRIGAETPNYVSNIYKYYLAYKMTLEQDARRQASRSAPVPSQTR